ncbi:menaquinone biosynthesis decarboxylase [Candidatus Acidulodesulfobacterium sp. H_13]|uniref:menaquinone biosynthesis decarboxylase n=1 Tax=Candidatus Acidulodesulfobacterium sp. H_13 TaxID=3395470 RepID=UPI003AF4AFD9
MAYKDLHNFIHVLEKDGDLCRIAAPVDRILEIAEIADRVVKREGPALLFENVKGFKFPVLINMFGSNKRILSAFEVNNLDDVADKLSEIIEPEIPTSFLGKIKSLSKLKKLADCIPKIVKTGKCKDVILDRPPLLDILPVLKTWPEDGGPFITLPLVFTKDPENGSTNVGMYRMQVYDDTSCGMHWHIHKDGARHFKKYKEIGKRIPVSVVIGSDPAVIYSATAPLPPDIEEMIFAGFLRGEAVKLVKCETNDLMVPANAEFVLEGYIDPNEDFRLEGPFGDHTGYYSLEDFYPVFHVTLITHRKDAIYPATIVGRPPMEDCYIGKATERFFLPAIKKIFPEIIDINLPFEGIFHDLVFISIKKSYPGHAKKVMHGIWGLGLMMFMKIIVILDEDVNVQDKNEVIWRISNNIDPKRDITFVEGPIDVLEHASDIPNYGSKMGIDATKKWASEGYKRRWPNDIVMSPDIKKLVDERWKEYGFN